MNKYDAHQNLVNQIEDLLAVFDERTDGRTLLDFRPSDLRELEDEIRDLREKLAVYRSFK